MLEKLLNNPMRNLVIVNRYSGQLLSIQESVSDHVWEMQAMALELVPQINRELKNYVIDLKEVIFRIAVHDLDECLSFDIPRPFKYDNPEITEAIRKTNDSIMAKNFSPELVDLINHAKDDDTREGYLVSVLDGMQAGMKMRYEVMIGNQFIKSQIPNIIELFNEKIYDIDKYREKYGDPFVSYIKNLMTDFVVELKTIVK